MKTTVRIAGRTLPRIVHGSAAVVLLALALAAPARAQVLTATILAIGDRAAQLPPVPTSLSIDLAECEANAPVVVRVANIPATASVLDVWAGAGCQDPTLRATTTSGMCNCLGIGGPTLGATQVDLSTTAQALLGVGSVFRRTSVVRTCENIALDADAPWPVLVLGVTVQCSTEVHAVYATVSNGTSAPFTVDTVPPAAPTDVLAADGDTAVPVTWMPSVGLGPGGTYELFAAPSLAGDAGTCGSPWFTAGSAASASFFRSTPSTATTLDAMATVSCGSGVAFAVAAVDRARNVSLLSDAACFTRTCSTPPPSAGGGCCSVAGGASPGACAVFALATTLLELGRRRRG